MLTLILLLLLVFLPKHALSFYSPIVSKPHHATAPTTCTQSIHYRSTYYKSSASLLHASSSINSNIEEQISKKNNILLKAIGPSCVGFFTSIGIALAEEMDTEIEVSDLPPPYVPLLFSLFLVGGIGLLTNSLGDVISEGKILNK